MEKSAETENQEAKNIIAKLAELSEETNMPITQENGQRCFGPPRDWEGAAPAKGTEVFVGKLPRDIYEPHLFPIFSSVGRIYKIRLMMDFSGTNRGYCFVQYATPGEAQRAIGELNDFEISKGRKIGVLKSVDNCRLFLGGLPKDKSEEEIFREICQHTEGVKKVIAYPSPDDKTKNRGFAFVEYESHKTAAMARRKLIPGNITFWGHDVCVDWAEPEPEVDPEIMNKVQNLYVRNLMISTTEERLRQVFNEASSNGVEKVKKIKDYAFIRFCSRDQADAARMSLNGKDIDGSQVEISWAKPVDKANTKPRSPVQHRQNGRANSFSPVSSRSSRTPSGYSPYSPTLPSPFSYISPQPLVSPIEISRQFLCYGYPEAGVASQRDSRGERSHVNPVEALEEFCRANGFLEPVYEPHCVAERLVKLYSFKIWIAPAGGTHYSEFRNDSYFPNEEIAKVNIAEKVLRRLTSSYVPCAAATVPFVLTQAVGAHPTAFAN